MGKADFSDSEEYSSTSSECSSKEESYESNQDLNNLDSESREFSSVSLTGWKKWNKKRQITGVIHIKFQCAFYSAMIFIKKNLSYENIQ